VEQNLKHRLRQSDIGNPTKGKGNEIFKKHGRKTKEENLRENLKIITMESKVANTRLRRYEHF
jgi:hypothetical protein